MYNINYSKNIENKLPIDNLIFRINELNDNSKKNIVFIKDFFDTSTFRYRAYNVCQTLKKSTKYRGVCFLVEELKRLYNLLDKIDLVILQRCKWSVELDSFINYCKSNHVKLIYDIDDLIYDLNYLPNYISSIGDYTDSSVNTLFALSGLYNKVMRSCDSFIVSTENLKKNVLKDFKKKVYHFNNYLNLEQEQVSEKICIQKNNVYDSSKFVIGYFSGSGTHERDFKIAIYSIIDLMEKYDNICLKIVGYMVLPDECRKYIINRRIEIIPLVSYIDLQYLIGSVDLNIVPLQTSEFNACKSELKFFEASIVNTLSLVSTNNVYDKIITDGVNGFICTENEWYSKMEYIYLNYDKLNKKITKKAKDFCLKKYSNHNQLQMLEKIFDEILRGERNEIL